MNTLAGRELPASGLPRAYPVARLPTFDRQRAKRQQYPVKEPLVSLALPAAKRLQDDPPAARGILKIRGTLLEGGPLRVRDVVRLLRLEIADGNARTLDLVLARPGR